MEPALAVLGLCGRSRAALVASPGGLGRSWGPGCGQEQLKSGQERPKSAPKSLPGPPKTTIFDDFGMNCPSYFLTCFQNILCFLLAFCWLLVELFAGISLFAGRWSRHGGGKAEGEWIYFFIFDVNT